MKGRDRITWRRLIVNAIKTNESIMLLPMQKNAIQVFEGKEQNSLISRIYIIIEHVIGGVKRCLIVKDVFRNTKEKFDDLVIEIACGLHNFRTAYRTG